MNIRTIRTRPRSNSRAARRGSILLLFCFALIVFMGMAALSVDVAFMHLTRTQLRKVADAASRAASGDLAVYQDMGVARQAAKDIASNHTVNGKPFSLTDAQIVFGRSDYSGGGWSFAAGGTPPNAVRVDASMPNNVGLFFGPVLGKDSFDPEQSAVAAAETRDICLVLDRSGSMAWDLSGTSWSYPSGNDQCTPPDHDESRWGVLAEAVSFFMNEVDQTAQQELVGLVTYSSDYTTTDCGGVTVPAARLEQSLTNDPLAILGSITAITNDRVIGMTNIAAGVDQGVQVVTDAALNRRFADKMIVLLTDGIENAGRDSRDAARDAAAQGVTIHTITFSDQADVTRMAEVAALTGGTHLHAPDQDSLRQAFLRIARGIPSVLID